jgi:hypothetical protein
MRHRIPSQLLPRALFPVAEVLCPLACACTYEVAPTADPASEIPPATCDTSAAPTWSGTIVPMVETHCVIYRSYVAGGEGTGDYSTCAGLHAKVVDCTLIPSIEWAPDTLAMAPEGDKFSDGDIAIIVRWVNAGVPNN